MVHDKLYRSEDLSKIDIGDYINTLANDLKNSYGIGSRNVTLEIGTDDIRLGVDAAIPCGIIINELVANSLKHAFPGDRTGEIAVSFREVDGNQQMIFRDDGVGLPADFDIDHPASLGWSIITALTSQLGGSIEFRCNSGSEVTITFPAHPSEIDPGSSPSSELE